MSARTILSSLHLSHLNERVTERDELDRNWHHVRLSSRWTTLYNYSSHQKGRPFCNLGKAAFCHWTFILMRPVALESFKAFSTNTVGISTGRRTVLHFSAHPVGCLTLTQTRKLGCALKPKNMHVRRFNLDAFLPQRPQFHPKCLFRSLISARL